MGDRCTVRFVNGGEGDEESVWLYWHWGGILPAQLAVEWVKRFGPYDPAPKTRGGGSMSTPETRREASWMVAAFLSCLPDFIPDRVLTEPLAADNGQWEVDLRTGEAVNIDGETRTLGVQ